MQTKQIGEFTVLLVDDHPVVAAGIRLALKQEPGCEFLGAETCPKAALKVFRERRPDAIILDLAFDRQVHLELVGQCRKILPEAAIIVFSLLPARAYRPEVLAAGADAFVSKSTDLETLVGLVARLLRSPSRRSAGIPEPSGSDLETALGLGFQRGVQLTPRERDIAVPLSRGTPIGDIAKSIGISAKTAAAHRDNLRKKLGCQDSGELIARLAHFFDGEGTE